MGALVDDNPGPRDEQENHRARHEGIARALSPNTTAPPTTPTMRQLKPQPDPLDLLPPLEPVDPDDLWEAKQLMLAIAPVPPCRHGIIRDAFGEVGVSYHLGRAVGESSRLERPFRPTRRQRLPRYWPTVPNDQTGDEEHRHRNPARPAFNAAGGSARDPEFH